MAELGTYDESAPPAESYDPIPTGSYIAQIEESNIKDTKTKTGEILTFKWRILDGEYQNRVIFDRVNIRNASKQAQEIGQRQLASIRLATGINSPRVSEELHNIPCFIKVKIRPAGPDKSGVHRDAQNEIKGYDPIGNKSAPAQPSQSAKPKSAPPPQQAAAGSTGKPPWKP